MEDDQLGYQVRSAQAGDAGDISRVIIGALRETNAKDYTPEIIARVELSFSPSAVERLIGQQEVFVALIASRVVGTVSLDGQVVRTMFVAPDVQGHGVGRQLMEAIEAAARERQIEVLHVSTTVTAEAFYAKLGFKAVREAFYGNERTIVMEREILPPGR